MSKGIKKTTRLFCNLLIAALTLKPALVWASIPEVKLTLKDHLFTPSKLIIPSHTKVKLRIINQDTTPEEFDSFDLNREKVIYPGRSAVVFIGPLPVGEYTFFGEFNPNFARGVVIVQDGVRLAEEASDAN